MSPASSRPYRPCVGVMLINRTGLVWVGKRHPDTGSDETYCWQMPQGGIDEGETPLDAARRELFEETSIRTTSLIAEAPNWISYDYPPEVARLNGMIRPGSSQARAHRQSQNSGL